MIRALKVWWFKRKAREAYLLWVKKDSDLSCGLVLGEYIRGLGRENAAMEFDFWIEKLRQLGEPVPNKRLSEAAK